MQILSEGRAARRGAAGMVRGRPGAALRRLYMAWKVRMNKGECFAIGCMAGAMWAVFWFLVIL